MENVIRAMRNLSSVPSWRTNLTGAEVDYWLENYSDLVICNGLTRRVVFEKITETHYVVYSKRL